MSEIFGALLSRENGPAPIREDHEKKRPELLLRELNHRWSNDMQLVLALLSTAARNAATPDAREALERAASRVGIIVANRAHLKSAAEADLELALCRAAKTIDALCDDRIEVKLEIDQQIPPVNPDLVLVIVLAVNEIATNAIKHAFGQERTGGAILITASVRDGSLIVTVEDDGNPWAGDEVAGTARPDGGLELVRRMVAGHGGRFVPPAGECKRFEFRFKLGRH
jgi:two-component sensor histidine kinase